MRVFRNHTATMFRLSMLAALVFGACVALPAQNCTVTSYGQGCGPVATGIVTPNGNTLRFAFTVNQGTPRARVLLVVGVNEQAVRLPGTPCFLLTEIAFSQQHRLDTTGSYTWSHALPADFHGYARVQFIEVDLDAPFGVAFTPSNGVLMEVP